MNKKHLIGHIITLFTIILWASTFISTKILLVELTPTEIMMYRFIIGYIALLIVSPKKSKKNQSTAQPHQKNTFKDELLFFALGLTGVAIYFFAENFALTYTTASNVGLLVTLAPIITIVLAHFYTQEESLKPNTFVGFFLAIVGVFFVMYNGKFIPSINPIGDLLALIAAVVWAFYSILLKHVSSKFKTIYVVRKSFFYGLILILIMAFFMKMDFTPQNGLSLKALLHLLFLGVGASALCFVLWNTAVNLIGVVKASNYIYLIPLLTMLASTLVLGETVNGIMMLGGSFILVGVYVSQNNIFRIFKTNKVATPLE